MSRHESLVRLRHMLDHSREAVAMVAGKTREDLDADRKLNLALVRLLEIVGEAANRTPADERAQYAQIPWAQIVGLRNRLIHGYDSVATGIEIYFNREDHQGRRIISVKSASLVP